jgi:hypothetical protein
MELFTRWGPRPALGGGTYHITNELEASVRTRRYQMLSTILIVVLILLLIGALPTWGYSGSWGYGPGGLVGVLLIVVIVLALSGRI